MLLDTQCIVIARGSAQAFQLFLEPDLLMVAMRGEMLNSVGGVCGCAATSTATSAVIRTTRYIRVVGSDSTQPHFAGRAHSTVEPQLPAASAVRPVFGAKKNI